MRTAERTLCITRYHPRYPSCAAASWTTYAEEGRRKERVDVFPLFKRMTQHATIRRETSTNAAMLDHRLFGFFFSKSKFRLLECHLLVIVAIIIVLFLPILCSSDCDRGCHHGVCQSDSCVCDTGWAGTLCEHCAGRTRLDSPVGSIYDSKGQYETDTTCVWLVDSGKPGTDISFYLELFATECSWDYLYIFDGDSIYAPLVAAFSGPVRYPNINIIHEVTTTSGYAYLYFYSDAAFKFEGFNVTYRVDSCPNGCSNHGVCNPTYNNCTCDPLWTGNSCDILACPSNCSDHGECSPTEKECVCDSGYQGWDCGQIDSDGYWQILDSDGYGRASAAVIQQDEILWILDGYDFNANRNFSIIRHNLDDGSSLELETEGDLPVTRFGHSAVLYQDAFYIYGGSLSSKTVTNELVIFNVTSSTWFRPNTTDSGVPPIGVEGHSAHVYNQTMLVLFGYSPQYGYTNMVQEYNLVNQTWVIAETTGVQVIGTYGHSSVLDPGKNVIYVHAGFSVAMKSSSEFMTDSLYQYDLVKKEWRVLPSSNQPRFLHTSVLLNDILYVFGGNTHTDSVEFTGAKCFSSDFLAYDTKCKTWSDISDNGYLSQNIARYGHAAVEYKGQIYIYSGFTGVMQESILLYTPANCSVLLNTTLCLDGKPGLNCEWDYGRNMCISYGEVNMYDIAHSNSSDQCPAERKSFCLVEDVCYDCLQLPGCGWCNDECKPLEECSDRNDIFCPSVDCTRFFSCDLCNLQASCQWFSYGKCESAQGGESTCEITCDSRTSCNQCLDEDGCMWCTNQNRCVDSKSYITSFPYGLCWEWQTSKRNCPASNCSLLKTCDACHADPHCGWCDSGESNGLGKCIEGSLTGPLKLDKDGNTFIDAGLCPSDSWFFFECPSCQCNGHSQCVNETSSICVNCQNNTTGPQCQTCAEGFFGDPLNGGSCSPCQCNNHATNCDDISGKCYCDTKGIIGMYCDRCDVSQRYYGNPLNGGTCYYDLSMNFKYTFNLSSNDELFLTMINLMTSPEVSNRDIEFTLQVNKEINLNVTFRTNDRPGQEIAVTYEAGTSYFSTTFSNSDYNFDDESNTTFFVYISNFTTPLAFEVSVRQRFLLLNLLEFLVVFFSCFLSFLLFFVVGWKVKQRYDSFRRQQNRAVELAVMARRPFAPINLVIENTVPPDIVAGTNKKQTFAFSFEVCSDNKAQVATLFMQMPMPDGDKIPVGQSRFSLASALIQVKPKKGERRNSNPKHQTRETARGIETNLNTSQTGVQSQSTPDTDRRPELYVIQNNSSGYDNAAMV
ncbi:attractin-like isoform X3 [Asterias amurensis]|uniref:attractin-like isoform X3 n=1 Tax=Asterias amurensis TaxID=7602 RepID=UPI003AB901C1